MSNMYNMPKFELSHKACGVADCMSCVFNVMLKGICHSLFVIIKD